MPIRPKDAIKSALSNPALREALTANAARRKAARARAYSTLPEPWEVMRERAAEVRAAVLANWDEVFQRFVENARRNGYHIHLVTTAEEARQEALRIVSVEARRLGKETLLIAKSKSMVSEEIGLNKALEAAGHRVVETDLGEYIIQLRGERPAHIITPAVHLRRQDVGRTFHEKLGVPYTEDVAEMTATARRVLRDVFLRADVGVSGANFGIAETGGICIVTNEGNGRMVTTLPRVHIALMGAERLVRDMHDLALMLELLPRSATGQQLTVYVSLLNGPRRAAEDAPEERHLIIVDDGRRRMASTPLVDGLRCIRCGACLNACPVFREIGGHAYLGVHGTPTPYPGPIGLVVSPALFGADEFGSMAQLCTLCGACAEACPVEVPLPELILRVRAGYAPPSPPRPDEPLPPPRSKPAPGVPWHLRFFLSVYSRVASVPALYKIAQRLAAPVMRAAAPLTPVPFLWGARSKPVPPEPVPTPQAPPEPQKPAAQEQKRSRGLVEGFTAALQALGGEVRRCSAAELPECVLAELRKRGATAVCAWADDELPAGLAKALRAAGVRFTQNCAEAAVGITGALAGIAASGTVVVTAAAGKPLRASLLPKAHFAVLPESKLVADLESALVLPELKQTSTAVLISGPSRTADIEMTLTIGVHGPEEVVVFLVSG